MKILQEKIEKHYNEQLPFVVYNKPNSRQVCGMFQKDASLNLLVNRFDSQGFVFAPFDQKGQTVLIPTDLSEVLSDALEHKEKPTNVQHNASDTGSEAMHKALVKKGVSAIKEGKFQKVVLSRKQSVRIRNIDVVNTYLKLLCAYPEAFVYVWFHPKVGLWFGASPETFLQLKENQFTTMSLASTQVYQQHVAPKWSQKEIDEQEFVTSYIVDKLSSFTKTLGVSKTTTVRAGSLVHLKTDITGVLDTLKEGALFSLINTLHPTPAVCGLPQSAAQAFIAENEQYDRSYYTGFLGELATGKEGSSDAHLFVNLRCMELEHKSAYVYVGGGITKDSHPHEEWLETLAKSAIMLNIL